MTKNLDYIPLPAEQRFKHACWLHMEFDIHRYLMCNAEGRWDGAEKATRHQELCVFFLSASLGLTGDYSEVFDSPVYKAVHEHTQKLTSYMDTEIGFPLKGSPGYDELAPKFFERFFELANKAITEVYQKPQVHTCADGLAIGDHVRLTQAGLDAIRNLTTPQQDSRRLDRIFLSTESWGQVLYFYTNYELNVQYASVRVRMKEEWLEKAK